MWAYPTTLKSKARAAFLESKEHNQVDIQEVPFCTRLAWPAQLVQDVGYIGIVCGRYT